MSATAAAAPSAAPAGAEGSAPAPLLVAYDIGAPMQRIVPAEARRSWMDATPQGFANRCLPLTVANAHGWFILSEADVAAVWTGGDEPSDVRVRVLGPSARVPSAFVPMGHFGSGVLTWHVNALFSTDPGMSLWVGGPPNLPKDGIVALTGLVETDWSPMTFTMNWRFTRPGVEVVFRRGEPFCHIFPLQRGLVPAVRPEIRLIDERPDLAARYRAWASARDRFNAGLRVPDSEEQRQGWQRHYHRGLNPDGSPGCPHAAGSPGHMTRVRPAPFADRRGGSGGAR